MRIVLDCFYALALLVASPWILYGLARTRGRLHVGARLGAGLPAVPAGALWLHGSSVGEVGLLAPLIAAIESSRPEIPIIVSSFTTAGIAAARQRYPRQTVIPLPLDFSFVVRRTLARLAPRAVVIVESDLWPNFVGAAQRLHVPVAVLNAKMSDRSCRLYRRFGLFQWLFRGLGAVGAQSAEHAERFESLGVPAPRVAVTGNMKYDLTPDADEGDLRERVRAALGIRGDEIVLVGASLHLPEDEAVLDCYATLADRFKGLRLVLVPRYPSDGGAIAGHAEARGIPALQKSRTEPAVLAGAAPGTVIVADTLGELRALYHAADVAYVGGSLYFRGANKGGHNLMEPAILGIPVVFGPHNFSFRETVADLLAADAGMQVSTPEELTAAVARLLESPAERGALGRRARRVVLERQGATARSLELIAPLLPGSPVAAVRATDDNAPVRT